MAGVAPAYACACYLRVLLARVTCACYLRVLLAPCVGKTSRSQPEGWLLGRGPLLFRSLTVVCWCLGTGT
jgi:hypothetical protein